MLKKLLVIVLAVAIVLSVGLAFIAHNAPEEAYPIPNALTVSVQIYDGETLLGTVTKATLEGLTQEKITMTTTNDFNTTTTSVYVAYNVKAAAEKLGITLPASITSVKAYATDDYSSTYAITSLDNAYISIGFQDDGVFAEDSKGPRFISDKNSGSSNSVAKYIAKIEINPVEGEEQEGEEGEEGEEGGEEQETEVVLAFSIIPTWLDGGRTLSIEFNDILSQKTNTIVLSTAEGDGVVTALTIDDKAPVDLSQNLLISYENKGVTYYGYCLADIISNMGKFKSGGSWMGFVTDYSSVRFICTDDNAEADYSARAYTQAEVEGATDIKVVYDSAATGEQGTSRVVSNLEDTDPATFRHKLKYVSTINIYIVAEED